MLDIPKVSVCISTYNQESFISECIESVLLQETSFPFEIIVSDDASTDNTAKIVEELQRKNPGRITFFKAPMNSGPSENYRKIHGAARGQYIAHIDGDDYALPGKLQAQSDYLDRHPQCNIVWHRMKIKNEGTGVIADDLFDFKLLPRLTFTRPDLLRYVTIGLHSSKMYRSTVRNFHVPNFPMLDFYINVEQIGNGTADLLQSPPLGVYRAGIGIASSGNSTKKLMSDLFIYFRRKYPQYRRNLATASTLMLLAGLKNRRWLDLKIYLPSVLATFSPFSIWDIWQNRVFIGMLRLPAIVKKNKP